MDYQPTNQMNQESSGKTWYVVILVAIIAVFALWYFSGNQAFAPTVETQSSALEQTQVPPLSNGNTTADISADISQTPDTSAALNQDAAASVQAVQGF